MGLTLNDQDTRSGWSSGTVSVTVDCLDTDLIVVLCASGNSGTMPISCADDLGNSYTMTAEVNQASGAYLANAYCLDCDGTNATNEITPTYEAGGTAKEVVAASFSIDGGDTVSLEDTATGQGSWDDDEAETAADCSITTTDGLAIAMTKCGNSQTFGDGQIPEGNTVTDLVVAGSNNQQAFYDILTGNLTNAAAWVDISANTAWVIMMLAFNSAGGAGAGAPTGTLFGPLGGPFRGVL